MLRSQGDRRQINGVNYMLGADCLEFQMFLGVSIEWGGDITVELEW